MNRSESRRRGAHPVLKSGSRWPCITVHEPPMIQSSYRFEGQGATAAVMEHIASLPEEGADAEVSSAPDIPGGDRNGQDAQESGRSRGLELPKAVNRGTTSSRKKDAPAAARTVGSPSYLQVQWCFCHASFPFSHMEAAACFHLSVKCCVKCVGCWFWCKMVKPAHFDNGDDLKDYGKSLCIKCTAVIANGEQSMSLFLRMLPGLLYIRHAG